MATKPRPVRRCCSANLSACEIAPVSPDEVAARHQGDRDESENGQGTAQRHADQPATPRRRRQKSLDHLDGDRLARIGQRHACRQLRRQCQRLDRQRLQTAATTVQRVDRRHHGAERAGARREGAGVTPQMLAEQACRGPAAPLRARPRSAPRSPDCTRCPDAIERFARLAEPTTSSRSSTITSLLCRLIGVGCPSSALLTGCSTRNRPKASASRSPVQAERPASIHDGSLDEAFALLGADDDHLGPVPLGQTRRQGVGDREPP